MSELSRKAYEEALSEFKQHQVPLEGVSVSIDWTASQRRHTYCMYVSWAAIGLRCVCEGHVHERRGVPPKLRRLASRSRRRCRGATRARVEVGGLSGGGGAAGVRIESARSIFCSRTRFLALLLRCIVLLLFNLLSEVLRNGCICTLDCVRACADARDGSDGEPKAVDRFV